MDVNFSRVYIRYKDIKWVGYRVGGLPPSTVSPCGRLRELILESDQLHLQPFFISEVVAYESFDCMSKFLECLRDRISVSVTGQYKSKVRMTCFSFHLKDCYLLLEATALLILLRCGSHPSELN